MGRYLEADLSKLRLISVRQRPTKVSVGDFARPAVGGTEAEALLARMPKQLGAERLRETVAAIVAARQAARPVVVLAGAHVIKVGASPYLNAWIEHGIVTHLA